MPNERAILVVDDEDVITWAISQGLSRSGGMLVETAQSGEQALEVLKRREFDLVITDIRMPGMNGFELLSHIRTLYPGTGVVVMTAYGSVEAKREATERGSLFYLDKTFEMDEMRQVVRQALEQVDRTRELREQEGEGFSGQISNLNLVDMVQLHCLARNTATLEVHTDTQRGTIGFVDGEIVHARTAAGVDGKDAFIDMLGWSGGQFETVDLAPTEQNIDESWESLLLAASDVIASASAPPRRAVKATPQPGPGVAEGPADMHSILEGLAIEQGIMAAFIAGDTGVLVDQVVTTYTGDPGDISELAVGLRAIGRVHEILEPNAGPNRVILQFERTRVLAAEISDTAVYLILVTSGAGTLQGLLSRMNAAVERLAMLF